MPKSRDRHGRGVRGPLALPNALTGRAVRFPRPSNDVEFFIACLSDSVAHIQSHCPEVLNGVDIGIEEVPSRILDLDLGGSDDAVPLAMALDADGSRPARVVLFRRPLHRRAVDRADLRELVHYTLVEQLSVLTTRPMHEIDPDLDGDY